MKEPFYQDKTDGILVEAFHEKQDIRIDVTVPYRSGTRTTGFYVELKKAHPEEHA